MPRISTLLGPIAVLVLGYLFLQKFEIDGLQDLSVRSRQEQAGSAAQRSGGYLSRARGDTILIASFNVQVFGETKLGTPGVIDTLADIIRQFDLVAIQEIRAKSQEVLPQFVRKVNEGGARYDYVLGPRLGRTTSKEQYAFVYNTATIEVDPTSVYTINDPDDLLHREPLVVAFRCRGAPPQEAFTFTLVNIHTDPDEVRRELDVLDDVFRVVRHDGRQEDDVIMLGDFNADDMSMGHLGAIPYIECAISGVPSNTRGTALYDNIVFDRAATVEYAGSSGVFDILRHYNLSMEQALQVSDHLPVWAEFSIYEGNQHGPLVQQPALRR